MIIAIGCDHGGIALKDTVISAVNDKGYQYIDFGTYDNASVDYPDYAEKVAKAILEGKADKGILLCGTGIGISIAANKFRGIRCAHVTDKFSARMCVEHNNANIIALGARITTSEDAYDIIAKYLSSVFDPTSGRHVARIEKITSIENQTLKN
ncbi:MAG: ribose 5-phosphate isomerase B [Christensenellaceae bacterium]|nr:ribose 5-phosphate isomerase B [Christensenellaceae bacterium]